jgi:hypothetical protein
MLNILSWNTIASLFEPLSLQPITDQSCFCLLTENSYVNNVQAEKQLAFYSILPKGKRDLWRSAFPLKAIHLHFAFFDKLLISQSFFMLPNLSRQTAEREINNRRTSG